MRLEYYCQKCKKHTNNQEMNSMLCDCGGEFRAIGMLFGERAIFEPYYDRVLRCHVSSYRDQEKKAHAHRSYSHPEGLMLVNDDKKFLSECKYMHKHREEYKVATRKGYRGGDGNAWKPETPDAHHHRGRVVFAGK